MSALFERWDPAGVAVVGLDLSLTGTGIAYASGEVATFEPKGMRGTERLGAIRQAVRLALDVCDRAPDLVVIEGYSYGSAMGMAALGELGGVVRMLLADTCAEHPNMGWAVAPPRTVKKYGTGNGNANKAAMVVAARDRLKYDGFSDDEADALWLRALGCEVMGAPLVPMPKVHMAALSGVSVEKAPAPWQQ